MHSLPYPSFPAMLKENARKFADLPALSYKKSGVYQTLSYAEFYRWVLMTARGLRKAGVEPGDRVAILSENRAGWAIADFAIQSVQGVTVPIYATSTAAQAAHVINHCGAKIAFVANRLHYDKLHSVHTGLPVLQQVVSFDRFMGSHDLPVYTLFQLAEISHPVTAEEQREIEALIDRIVPDDLMTIIYTSGTTGTPKGVMLSHANMLFDAHCGLEKLEGLDPQEVFLSFLPLSHVLERTAGYHAPLMTGCCVAFAESVDKVLENMQEVRPTVMVSVPRLFEKIYSRIHEGVHQASPLRRKLFHWSVEVGREYIARRYMRRQPLGLLALKYRLADRLVFGRIRQRFGGRMHYFISGGAPLDKTINEFMWVLGFPTFEGYGLTETSPAIAINSPWRVRFGSVGTLLPGTEAKLAEDGELLVRGPQVMRGYYADHTATTEVFQDGWFRTGDIASIDADGYLYIIDRKKELIITSGGKNIAPQPLENLLRMDKYISQAMVFGDRKPFLVALLTPNIERLIELARQWRLNYFDIEDLVANQRILEMLAARIEDINRTLPSYETIKRFVLLPREFSVDGGELTPTLKLKRKVIYEKYRARIEQLYLPNGAGPEYCANTAYGGDQ